MLQRIKKFAGNVKNHVEKNKVHYLWAAALVGSVASVYIHGQKKLKIVEEALKVAEAAAKLAWSHRGHAMNRAKKLLRCS
jgi:hypothetical protein